MTLFRCAASVTATTAVLLLLLISTSFCCYSAAAQDMTAAKPQCGLWMGPSTLGGDTNLGMYTGKDIAKGVDVQQEIAIPLLFREWDGPHYYDTDDGQLWDRYIWEGDVANVETYDNTDTINTKAVFVPGIGCTINSILDMHNVESTHGSTFDTAGLHRSRDPGSGAFTPYYGTHTVSVEPIPAGSEIFAAYGDTWIPEIPGAQITFDPVLESAEEFLRDDYKAFVDQHKKELKQNVLQGLWEFTRDFPLNENHIFSVLPREVQWTEISAVLEEKTIQEGSPQPQPTEDFDGNTVIPLYEKDKMVTRHFIRQQGKRDLEWLERNARCCDHIRPGRSTIEQAGRGAFASRDLPKGTIVGYSPLIHVGLEGDNLYNIPYGEKDPDGNPEGFHGYKKLDLVVNYSFRHRESTIMLTPYGSMVNYINHDPDRANVRVVWPEEELIAHKPDWLKQDVTTLRHTIEKIGLSFDYVALRDIREGEELFMDYGEEWQEAWEQHLMTWKPLPGAKDYVHSSEWPADEPLRTEEVLKNNPYPANLETMCVESYRKSSEHRYSWLPVLRPSNERVPCTVLKRFDPIDKKSTDEAKNNYTYAVEMLVEYDEETDEEIKILVEGVPQKWIFLTDKVKTADWHMPNTFRHAIAIPDDIFPEAWKNRKKGAGTKAGGGHGHYKMNNMVNQQKAQMKMDEL